MEVIVSETNQPEPLLLGTPLLSLTMPICMVAPALNFATRERCDTARVLVLRYPPALAAVVKAHTYPPLLTVVKELGHEELTVPYCRYVLCGALGTGGGRA